MALGLTQLLTETIPKNLLGGKARPARKANKFAAICELPRHCGSLEASQTHGTHGLLQG
jgi:hypothetical protein